MLNTKNKLINPEVRIETTNRCNAHCVMCPREKMTRPKTTMCWGHFTQLINQAVELGATDASLFGFGEPLCDPDLENKINYASDMGLTTHITTNASLLSLERCWNLLDAGLKNIRFSIHAITPIDYGKVHIGLDWLRACRNIGNFLNANKKRGHPCTTHLTFIPQNSEKVREIRDSWEKYFDYLEIWRPHNWNSGRNYRKGRQRKASCGRPFSGPVQIQADGTVIPCCFLTNSEIVLGNTWNNSIVEILKDWPYARLQMAHRMGRLHSYPCSTCDQLYVEETKPLLYSNRDKARTLNTTSTCKVPIA